MKLKEPILLIAIIFFITTLFAQQRGFKPVKVEGTGTSTLYEESHALVIGNSNYTEGWNDLPGVKTDVYEVKTALEQNGFNVVLKENLTKEEMDKAYSDFIKKYGENANNRLLFYYAGHGHTVTSKYGDEIGYIVPINAPNPNKDEADFQSKSMEMAQIEIYAKRIDSKHALFMFDACFAGSLFAMRDAVPAVINYKTKEPVRQFITSGSADETVPDKSIFREQFVIALTTNNADANNDGYLTGTELGTFLQNKVINYSYENQHPQYGKIRHSALDKGDFVFVLKKKSAPQQTETEIEEEDIAPVVSHGNLKITNYLQGSLYIDGIYKQTANKNKVITISDLNTGTHTIKIITDSETWEQKITINKGQTAQLTAKNNSVPQKKEENKNTSIKSKAGLIMITTKGGIFQMGDDSREAYVDERPVHTVTVGDFAISKTEITNLQYCKFLNEKGNQSEGSTTWLDLFDTDCQIIKNRGKFQPKAGKENYPVVEVTWYGAKAYCEWAGGRLPTEAEWQFACKSQNDYKYSGSYTIDEVAWYKKNSNGVNKVAQKKSNSFGLYDMSGNVGEWVQDEWHDNYKNAPTDGSAWENENKVSRVFCGGSFNSNARDCRVSARVGKQSNYGYDDIGFRIVVSL